MLTFLVLLQDRCQAFYARSTMNMSMSFTVKKQDDKLALQPTQCVCVCVCVGLNVSTSPNSRTCLECVIQPRCSKQNTWCIFKRKAINTRPQLFKSQVPLKIIAYLQICPSCKMWMTDCNSQIQREQDAVRVLLFRAAVALLLLLLVVLLLLAVDACLWGVDGWAPTSPCEAEQLSSFPSMWEQLAAPPPKLSSVLKSCTNHRKLKTCTENEPSTTKNSVSPNHQ